MEYIKSRSNPRIKAFTKVRDGLERGIFFVVEGKKLLREVLKSSHEVIEAFVLKGCEEDVVDIVPSDATIHIVTNEVMEKLSVLRSYSSVAALCRISKEKEIKKPVFEYPWIVLDGVQDPANVGVIFRSVEAFGCPLVVLLPGVPSPFHYKVIRASAGSSLRVRCWICREREDFFRTIMKQSLNLWFLEPNSETKLDDVSGFSKAVFLLGNEGHGPLKESIKCNYSTLKIPMKGEVESLNVAVAASILLYWFSINS